MLKVIIFVLSNYCSYLYYNLKYEHVRPVCGHLYKIKERIIYPQRKNTPASLCFWHHFYFLQRFSVRKDYPNLILEDPFIFPSASLNW